MSEFLDREDMEGPSSGIASTGESGPAKKKGLKGIFKRKDKDAK